MARRDVGDVRRRNGSAGNLSQGPDHHGGHERAIRVCQGRRAEPEADQQHPSGDHGPGRQPLGDTGERQFQEDDDQTVQGDERSVGGIGQPARPDVERERGRGLKVHKGNGHRGQQEAHEERVPQDSPCALPALFLHHMGAHSRRQRPERDDAEQHRRQGIPEEEEEEGPVGQQPGRGRADGETRVDRQPVEGECRHPLRRRHQVGEQGTAGRPVHLRSQTGEAGQQDDERQGPGLGEEHQHGRRGEHREHDGGPAPQAVRHNPADCGGGQTAHTVGPHRGTRRRRGVALADQVEDQEGHDEAAEPVDERSGEQGPGRRRQRADHLSQ